MTGKIGYFIKYLLKPLLFSIGLVFIDQVSKYIVRSEMSVGDVSPVLSFFQISYVTNTGIAFSMFQGANTFFSIFTALVLIGFVAWYAKNVPGLQKPVKAAVVLVISGAASNLIDRISFGHVIDFLDIYVGKYHWPAFNIADSCISIGGVILFLWILVFEKENMTPKKEDNVPNNN